MPADALKCKECSTTYPLDARYVCERCFGPLEVAYTRARRRAPASSSAGSRRARSTLWRYADFLPLEGAAQSALPTGWTPLVRADRLAERLGLGEVWVKNETANPTHSFKDRVVSVALARAQELGFDDDRLRLDRQPRQRRRRPRRRRRARVLRLHPGRPRGGEDPRHGRLRHERRRRQAATTTTSTGSAPRSPASAPWAFVNVNLRPVLRRGLEDARASRSPSSSAGSCPTAWSRRSPPARCSRRSRAASRSASTPACSSGELPTFNGAQALGCSPVATAFAAGTDVCRPVKPDTIAKSLAIGNPADGPYARRAGARAPAAAIDSRHRRRDPRGHPPAGRDDRHLHRDRRRRDHRGAGQARRARRHRPATSASSPTSPATA